MKDETPTLEGLSDEQKCVLKIFEKAIQQITLHFPTSRPQACYFIADLLLGSCLASCKDIWSAKCCKIDMLENIEKGLNQVMEEIFKEPK